MPPAIHEGNRPGNDTTIRKSCENKPHVLEETQSSIL